MSKQEVEQIIQLYKSGSDVNIELALELENSLRPNLSHFWKPVHQLYIALRGTGPRNKQHAAEVLKAERLNLSNHGLSRIPEAVFWLKRLRDLRLSLNRLAQIPDLIAELNSLEKLDLSHNPLRELNSALSELEQLELLSLEATRIHYIPAFFKGLTNLRKLNLSQNTIK